MPAGGSSRPSTRTAQFPLGERRREADDLKLAVRVALFCRHGVRRDGQQLHGTSKGCLLQQAATPSHASDVECVAGFDGGAVGGERQVGSGGHVGQHLVAPVASCRDHGLRTRSRHQLDHALRPGLGCVLVEALVLRHVHRGGAVGDQPPRDVGCRLADHYGLQGHAELLGQAASERQRLERQLVRLTPLVVDQDEDHLRRAPAPATPRRPGAQRRSLARG